MKIVPGSQQATPAVEKTENKTEKIAPPASKQAAGKPRPAVDQVEFSDSLNASLKSQQDLQSKRVEDIKARIQAGTYQVSSRDVAEKMLSNPFDF